MNKLYKYLPFSINCVWRSNNDAYFKKDKIYSLNELLLNSNNYDLEEFNDFVEHNKIKPILRPFEDLTKELPLTKAAAEMIDMKEGEVVKVIMYFFKLVANDFNLQDDNYCYQEYVNGDLFVKVHRFNSVSTNGIDLYQDWLFTRWYNNIVNYNEKPFDFLRAMKFAVDFKEDEYIKLVD